MKTKFSLFLSILFCPLSYSGSLANVQPLYADSDHLVYGCFAVDTHPMQVQYITIVRESKAWHPAFKSLGNQNGKVVVLVGKKNWGKYPGHGVSKTVLDERTLTSRSSTSLMKAIASLVSFTLDKNHHVIVGTMLLGYGHDVRKISLECSHDPRVVKEQVDEVFKSNPFKK